MLEKIDEINWKELSHAYGSADNIPRHIKALLDPDAKVRGKARWSLYGNIYHQGTRYEASPFAIPFLLELIASEETLEREELILFLVNLALGFEEDYLPEGLDIKDWRKNLEEAEATLSEKDRAEYKEFGYSAQAILDCYDNVKNGIPVLEQLMHHADPKIARAAVYALAWFPERAEASILKIKTHLASLSEERAIAVALLSLGLLSNTSEHKVAADTFSPYLDASSTLVRLSAAIALAENPLSEQILNELIQGVLANKEWKKNNKGLHFNDGDIAGYASMVLARYGFAEKEKVIPALCKVLESVSAYQALDITAAILEILNKDRTESIENTPLAALDHLELQSLKAILDHGGWSLGHGTFVNFTNLLKAEGIPDNTAALSAYLQNGPATPAANASKNQSPTPTNAKESKSQWQKILAYLRDFLPF